MLRPRTAVLLSRGRRPAWSWRRGGGGRAASAAGWAGLPPWPRPGLRAFQTPPCRRLRYILRPGSLPGKVPAGTRSDSPASATGKRILDFDQCCSMCLICITSFHPQSKAVGRDLASYAVRGLCQNLHSPGHPPQEYGCRNAVHQAQETQGTHPPWAPILTASHLNSVIADWWRQPSH